MKKKTNKWIKLRHVIIQRLAKVVLYPFVKIKYGAKIIKCKENRQRIIIANHQTAFDQFFIAYGYKAPIYYLASEDIFSNGFISKLLRYAVNPIPIKKQSTDVRAVMNCMKVAKEGGTIAIFPEGNRTFSGTTEYMSIAIVKLIKALKLPLTFFKIEGGYGVQPRWSDKVRKGKIKAYTSKTLEFEEYVNLTEEQLYELIKKELYVDERLIKAEYNGKNLAEYLERAIYVCPHCGFTKFFSDKNTMKCLTCGREIEYLPNKKIVGMGFTFEFDNVKDWYDYQTKYMASFPIEKYFDAPLFTDMVSLYQVEPYKKKHKIIQDVGLVACGNKMSLDCLTLEFDKVSAISVLGRNKLNVYCEGKIYQIKGDKRFNAVKYVNLYYRYKNYVKGENNVEFLGL